MAADRSDLGEQFLGLLDGVSFPVSSRSEIESQLGGVSPSRRFESGEFSMTLVRLDRELRGSEHIEYPYESAEALVDDVLAALESEGYL